MHYPRRRNVTTSMVGLKKTGHIRKNLTQHGESQRYSWGTQRKKKKPKGYSLCSPLQSPAASNIQYPPPPPPPPHPPPPHHHHAHTLPATHPPNTYSPSPSPVHPLVNLRSVRQRVVSRLRVGGWLVLMTVLCPRWWLAVGWIRPTPTHPISACLPGSGVVDVCSFHAKAALRGRGCSFALTSLLHISGRGYSSLLSPLCLPGVGLVSRRRRGGTEGYNDPRQGH